MKNSSVARTIVAAVVVALPACRNGSPTPPVTPRSPVADDFIVGLEMGNEVADPGVADWRLDQAVAVGARWVRVYVPWMLVEQQKGVLAWSGLNPRPLPSGRFDMDRLMEGIRSRGLRAIAIVQYTPPWARSGRGDMFTPPDDPQAYADFAKEVVKRYRDVVRIVEIWNEVNIDDSIRPPDPFPGWTPFWHGSVPQYVGILNAAHDAVKSADPTVVVLSSGLAALTPPLVSKWLDAFFANSPKPRFDWFGWHPYGLVPEAGPDASDGTTGSFRGFEQIARRLDEEGYAGASILLSEFGYRYDVGDASMQSRAEEQVAHMLPEAFAVARASSRIRGLVWFSVRYHGGDGDFGLYSDSRRQRTSFKALQTWASLTARHRFAGAEGGTDNGTKARVYRFSDVNGKRLWMVYTPCVPPGFAVIEPQTVTVRVLPSQTVTLVNRDGVRSLRTADDTGAIKVSATRQPLYIVEP